MVQPAARIFERAGFLFCTGFKSSGILKDEDLKRRRRRSWEIRKGEAEAMKSLGNNWALERDRASGATGRRKCKRAGFLFLKTIPKRRN